jgi:hypothetical protein
VFAVEERPPGIVRLAFAGGMSAADEAAYLRALDELSKRTEPFVVVAVLDGRTPLSPAGKKAQALWFKRSRGHLGQVCRGLIRVPMPDVRADPGGEALERALPFPLVHAASEAEAVELAERLLAGGR